MLFSALDQYLPVTVREALSDLEEGNPSVLFVEFLLNSMRDDDLHGVIVYTISQHANLLRNAQIVTRASPACCLSEHFTSAHPD